MVIAAGLAGPEKAGSVDGLASLVIRVGLVSLVTLVIVEYRAGQV